MSTLGRRQIINFLHERHLATTVASKVCYDEDDNTSHLVSLSVSSRGQEKHQTKATLHDSCCLLQEKIKSGAFRAEK